MAVELGTHAYFRCSMPVHAMGRRRAPLPSPPWIRTPAFEMRRRPRGGEPGGHRRPWRRVFELEASLPEKSPIPYRILDSSRAAGERWLIDLVLDKHIYRNMITGQAVLVPIRTLLHPGPQVRNGRNQDFSDRRNQAMNRMRRKGKK